MADTLESLELEVKHSATGVADEIKQVTSAIRSMGKALDKVLPSLKVFKDTMGGSGFNVNNNSTLQVADTINNVNQAANKAKSSTKEAAKGVKELSGAASKAKSPLETFISSLKRIAMYRILRSIIKAVTQAFKEGLEYAYTFSQGITTEGHRFAEAMDSMKSAGTKMKNKLGSAFIGLLTAIAPIVNAIISLITKLADALSQLFAIFTGGTYLKAADMPKKWADAAGGAGKAAKEWKNQLLGFDEINRLNEPSDGGGGGGGGLADAMSAFEDTPIDGIFAKIRDKLIELKNELDFEPLKKSWDNLKESVQALADTILSGLAWAWENVLKPLAHWTIEQAAPTAINLLAAAIDFLNAVLKALAPVFQWAWDNIFKPLAEWTGELIIAALKEVTSLLKKLTDLLNGNTTFKDFLNDLSPIEELLLAIGAAIAVVYTALGVYNGVMAISTAVTGGLSAALAFLAANPIVLVIAGLTALILIVIEVIKHWEELVAWYDKFREASMEAIGNGKIEWWDFAAIAIGAIETIIQGISILIGWLQSLVSWINTVLEGFSFIQSANARADAIQADGSIYLQGFASGGYPDEGQLFVARESGAELVGNIGGRTAVASNSDILEGIRQGVFEAVTAAMGGVSFDPEVKVYLDSREIRTGQNRIARAMGVG